MHPHRLHWNGRMSECKLVRQVLADSSIDLGRDLSQVKGVIMPVVSSGESQATAGSCVPVNLSLLTASGGLLWTFAVCMESKKHKI